MSSKTRSVNVTVSGHESEDYDMGDPEWAAMVIGDAVKTLGLFKAYRILHPVKKWRIEGDGVVAVTTFTVIGQGE